MSTSDHRKAALLMSVLPRSRCEALLASLGSVDSDALRRSIAYVRARGWDHARLIELAMRETPMEGSEPSLAPALARLLDLAQTLEAPVFARVVRASVDADADFLLTLLPQPYASEVKEALAQEPVMSPALTHALLRAVADAAPEMPA
ncbi:MAG TPA: hypothetical protein VM687_09955 [Stenotrophomonas sp.]|nr:hypothetical protein [Stenotrophomonas sp.]